jgi:PEP-CTERM motif
MRSKGARWLLRFPFAVSVLALIALPQEVGADPFTYGATNGPGAQSAQISITVSGSDLLVTLSNTSTGDPSAPSDILTGVFFDITGYPTLTLKPVSAVICGTCSVTSGGLTDSGGGVGGEWAYKRVTDLAYGADYGISSSGLNLFGPKDLIGGTSFLKNSPGGVGYGITSNYDSSGNNNGGISGMPLIMNAVLFDFAISGVAGKFDPSAAISNVTFQYGTKLNEVHVPEPATATLIGLGVLAIGVCRRKRAA